MKYLKSFLYVIGLIIVTTLIITLLNYIGVVSGISLNIIKLIIPIISIFIGGIIIGKNSSNKGWLNGMKIGGAVILLFVLLLLILDEKITLKTVLYYLVLLSTCVFGSMIGISKSKTLQ